MSSRRKHVDKTALGNPSVTMACLVQVGQSTLGLGREGEGGGVLRPLLFVFFQFFCIYLSKGIN